jgi:hypothetical protein
MCAFYHHYIDCEKMHLLLREEFDPQIAILSKEKKNFNHRLL